MIQRIICLFIGYICGLFQTGYIVGKLKGIDIREHGSGNAGTTNMLRTMGLKYAVLVLMGDALKCGLAILIVRLIYADSMSIYMRLLYLYAAAGVILGHNFPFYMGFKGGKGMAATAGFILFGMGPVMSIVSLAIFIVVFCLTHYVSLGSILVYVGLAVSALVCWKYDFLNFTSNGIHSCYYEYTVIIFLLMIMACWRHHANIARLIAGNERKTYLKSNPEIDL